MPPLPRHVYVPLCPPLGLSRASVTDGWNDFPNAIFHAKTAHKSHQFAVLVGSEPCRSLSFSILAFSQCFPYPLLLVRSYGNINYCPHCFQSRGPSAVRARAENLTPPTELELYGDGQWPHYSSYLRGELLPNGNYYEIDAIAVRHGICGDPEQVSAGTGIPCVACGLL